MHKAIKWYICLLFISHLTGCAKSVDSGSNNSEALSAALQNFSIQSDQNVYKIGQENIPLEITYSYINEGNQNFYLGSCLGAPSEVLEKLIDGEWIIAYKPVCPDILRSPIMVEPGKPYEAIIHLPPSIWDPAKEDLSWHQNDIQGTYRVRERVFGEWSMEKHDNGTLESEIVVSNPFEIRMEL